MSAPLRGDGVNVGEAGVVGTSAKFDGVLGVSIALGQAGIAGTNDTGGVTDGGGNGVYGRGTGNGVFGIAVRSDDPNAAVSGAGVVGTCTTNDGVRGFSESANHSGVVGTNDHGGFGVLGQVSGGANAATVGINNSGGVGIYGTANTSRGGTNPVGVVGEVLQNGSGVFGHCGDGLAVHAIAEKGIAVRFG